MFGFARYREKEVQNFATIVLAGLGSISCSGNSSPHPYYTVGEAWGNLYGPHVLSFALRGMTMGEILGNPMNTNALRGGTSTGNA